MNSKNYCCEKNKTGNDISEVIKAANNKLFSSISEDNSNSSESLNKQGSQEENKCNLKTQTTQLTSKMK